jgi:hypothetical protein
MAVSLNAIDRAEPATLRGQWPAWSPGLRFVIGAILLTIACGLAGIKPLGFSADLENYRSMFELSVQTEWSALTELSDLGYHAFAKLSVLLGLDFAGFTLWLAIATCSLKARVLGRLDTDRTLLLLLYFSYLFWLHEYTQIRLGLAMGFVLLALYVPTRANALLYALAVLTHASTAVIVALHFAFRRPRAAAAMIVASIVILLVSGLAETVVASLASRALVFVDLFDLGVFTELNILSSMPAVQTGILVALLPRLRSLSLAAREEYMMASVGIIAFYGLSFLPALAFRFNELLMPFLLVLISRTWRQSPTVALGALLYILSGLRTSFFSSGSLIFSGGG